MKKQMLKFRVLTAVTVGVACLTSPAFADKFNTETSSSVRALGMGNAAINTERGAYAVFYNPANIAAKNTGTNIQLVDIKMDINEPSLGMLSRFSLPMTHGLQTLAEKAQENPGEYISTAYSIYPNITIRNFSVGLLYEFNQGAEYDPATGSLRIRARNRFAPTAALSFRLFKGIFRFGASTQYVSAGNADTVQAAPIPSALDFRDYISSGAGFVHTAGATLTIPMTFLPSFSFVARNIMGTTWDKPQLVSFGNSSITKDTPMTFDMAASATIYLGRRLELRPEVDYRDTLNQLDGIVMRHIFAGAELVMFDVLKLRAGVAHGYMSFGLGLTTKSAALDLAVYADEKDDGLRSNMDQRYVLQYTWGLFK